jgi:hypothetical protein
MYHDRVTREKNSKDATMHILKLARRSFVCKEAFLTNAKICSNHSGFVGFTPKCSKFTAVLDDHCACRLIHSTRGRWLDLLYHIESLHYFTKHAMPVIKPWSLHGGDEKLQHIIDKQKQENGVFLGHSRHQNMLRLIICYSAWLSALFILFFLFFPKQSARNTYLTPVGVWASIRHGQKTRTSVLVVEVLIWESAAVDALTTGAVSCGEVTALDHKLRDHSVEAAAFVTESFLPGAKGPEVLRSFGHFVAVQAHDNASRIVTSDRDVKVYLNMKHQGAVTNKEMT